MEQANNLDRTAPGRDGGQSLPLAELFYSLQGEGFHTGQAACFVRLGGCDVRCPWCDAKYTWDPGRFPRISVEEIVRQVRATGAPAAVVTGGEPLMHPLGPLTEALQRHGVQVWIETSGSRPLSGTADWICLSPKTRREPLPEMLARADELKVVVSGPEDLLRAEKYGRQVAGTCLLYLQPEWDRRREVTPLIVGFVQKHPRWRVSLQTHKFLDIP